MLPGMVTPCLAAPQLAQARATTIMSLAVTAASSGLCSSANDFDIATVSSLPSASAIPVTGSDIKTDVRINVLLFGAHILLSPSPANHEHGKHMVPGLSSAEVTTWMGHRPGMPDTLPVIGRSPRFENVDFAFRQGLPA
jgi:hypothetical protein